MRVRGPLEPSNLRRRWLPGPLERPTARDAGDARTRATFGYYHQKFSGEKKPAGWRAWGLGFHAFGETVDLQKHIQHLRCGFNQPRIAQGF